jgi:hypothetical protein
LIYRIVGNLIDTAGLFGSKVKTFLGNVLSSERAIFVNGVPTSVSLEVNFFRPSAFNYKTNSMRFCIFTVQEL